MFWDLFALMASELDVTLFKGGGPTNDREKVPTFLPRNGRIVKLLPIHKLVGRTAMHVECMTFALSLLPYLRDGRFDVVHCIDPPLARVLYKLRRLFGMKFRLLYTHGCSMPPSHYPPADHIQEVSKVPYDDAVKAGFPARSITLLPCGIHPEHFAVRKSRDELRREHGISPDTFVILSIAALNRSHKRTHYLVDEAARMQGNFLLWLDGSIDQGEPDLIEYAKSRLGERCRITHVPSLEVGELHRMADVMAHAALFEAFGLSVLEAVASGLPVLTHDSAHFRWLLPNPNAWVDMSSPGALAERLSHLMTHREGLREVRCGEDVWRRFTWDYLRQDYRHLYERVSALPMPGLGDRRTNYFWQLHG